MGPSDGNEDPVVYMDTMNGLHATPVALDSH